jgi:hypothetical protein
VSRRTLAGGVAIGLILVALIPLGRWERSRSLRARLDGIDRVAEAVGPGLTGRDLSAYRIARPVDCLMYASGPISLRWELCFDVSGRLVEAIDRRTEPAHIWSVREEPGAARVRVGPRRLFAIFRRLGAFQDATYAGTLPTAYETYGPRLRPMLEETVQIGRNLAKGLTGYRISSQLWCLVYLNGKQGELCFDRAGRLRAALDPIGQFPESVSARASPARAKPWALFDLLRSVGAVPSTARFSGILPPTRAATAPRGPGG